jgi:uncharacterized protein YeaO (DUF488 family)
VSFRVKRVYEPPAAADGKRILVDRLWPRGMKKADAKLDAWLKDVAPSTKLRLWYNHDPERFAEFRRRYAAELEGNPAFDELRRLGKGKVVTLLYGSREPRLNHAIVLQSLLSAG